MKNLPTYNLDYPEIDLHSTRKALLKIIAGTGVVGGSKTIESMVGLKGEKPRWHESLFEGLSTRSLLGFRTSNDGGEGMFYWDQNRSKEKHDGGTIIDPYHTAPIGTIQWYKPDNQGSGCWVRLETQKQTGEKFVYPLSWYGLIPNDSSGSVSKPNGFVMSLLLRDHHGFFIDNNYYFSKSLKFNHRTGGQHIKGINRRKSKLEWVGLDSDWAFRAKNKNTGVYNASFDNFTLRAYGKTKNGANLTRFVFSRFNNFSVNGFYKGVVHAHAWGNYFTKCRFNYNNIGVLFGDDQIFGLDDNLSNANRFVSCAFKGNSIGHQWHQMGYNNKIVGCIISQNDLAVDIRSQNTATNLIYEENYIEKNKSIFEYRQSKGGHYMKGVIIRNNFISGHAGLNDFKFMKIHDLNNVGHIFIVENNIFDPPNNQVQSETNLLTLGTGVELFKLILKWNGNVVPDDNIRQKIEPFKQRLDWTRIITDVQYVVKVNNPNVEAIKDLTIKLNNGIATLSGIINIKQTTTGEITERLPQYLRAQKDTCAKIYSYTGSQSVPDEATININDKRIIVVNAKGVFDVEVSWNIGNHNSRYFNPVT